MFFGFQSPLKNSKGDMYDNPTPYVPTGSGTSLDDSSANSNTGTLNGGIAWDSNIVPGKTRTIASNRSLANNRIII